MDSSADESASNTVAQATRTEPILGKSIATVNIGGIENKNLQPGLEKEHNRVLDSTSVEPERKVEHGRIYQEEQVIAGTNPVYVVDSADAEIEFKHENDRLHQEEVANTSDPADTTRSEQEYDLRDQKVQEKSSKPALVENVVAEWAERNKIDREQSLKETAIVDGINNKHQHHKGEQDPVQQAEANRLRDDILEKISAVQLALGLRGENNTKKEQTQTKSTNKGDGPVLSQKPPIHPLASSVATTIRTPQTTPRSSKSKSISHSNSYPRRKPRFRRRLTPTQLLQKKQSFSVQQQQQLVVAARAFNKQTNSKAGFKPKKKSRVSNPDSTIVGIELPDVSHMPYGKRMVVYQRFASSVLSAAERRLLQRLKTAAGSKIMTLEAAKNLNEADKNLPLESRILRAKIQLISAVRAKAHMLCWKLVKERERQRLEHKQKLDLPTTAAMDIIAGKSPALPPPTPPPPEKSMLKIELPRKVSTKTMKVKLDQISRIWRSSTVEARPKSIKMTPPPTSSGSGDAKLSVGRSTSASRTRSLTIAPKPSKPDGNNARTGRTSVTADFRNWIDDAITDVMTENNGTKPRSPTSSANNTAGVDSRFSLDNKPVMDLAASNGREINNEPKHSLMVDLKRLKEGRALRKKMGHEKKYQFPRYVWLSDDETAIFWAKGTSKVGAPKNLQLKNFKTVRGQLPANMTRQDKKSLKENYCFSIISGNNRQTLDLQFAQGDAHWQQHVIGEREIWIKSLQFAINRAHDAALNPQTSPPVAAPAGTQVAEIEQQQTQVLEVINNFMEREREYVKQLDDCMQQYIARLKLRDTTWKQKLMRDSSMKPLISSFEALASQTAQLFQDIRSEKLTVDGVMLGLRFSLNYAPMLSQFSQYQEVYLRAGNQLRVLANSAYFKKFQENVQNANMPMLVYLGLPLRQIHEYTDTINRLHALTPEQNPDFEHQTRALKLLQDTASEMATVTQQIMAMTHLTKIERRFMDGVKLVMKGRTLVHEGKLTKLSRKAKRKYHFHLFNDILMYSQVKGGKFQLHRALQLHACAVTVSDEQLEEGSRPLSRRERKKLASAALTFEIASAEKTFQVIAANAADKAKWVRLLRKNIASIKAQNSHLNEDQHLAPRWQQDDTSNECYKCHRTFTLITRRHHCRKCGRLCCDNCSKSRLQLTNISQAPVRVCDRCKDDMAKASKRNFGLHVHLDSCHFLAPSRGRRPNNRHPFVTMQLQQVHRQSWRSSTMRNTINPQWTQDATAIFSVDQLSSAQLTLQVWDEKKMQQPGFLGQCEVDLESVKAERPNSKSSVDPRCIATEEYTKQLKSRVVNDQTNVSGDIRFHVIVTAPEAILKGDLNPKEMVELCDQHVQQITRLPSKLGVAACSSLLRLCTSRMGTSIHSRFLSAFNGEGVLLKVEADYTAPLRLSESKNPERGISQIHAAAMLGFLERHANLLSKAEAGLVTRLKALETLAGVSPHTGSLEGRLLAVYKAEVIDGRLGFELREGEVCMGLQMEGERWLGVDARGFLGNFPATVVRRDVEEEARAERMQRLIALDRLLKPVMVDVFQRGLRPRSTSLTQYFDLFRLVNTALATPRNSLPDRQRVIHELLQTERDYVQSLQALQRLYVTPLLQSRDCGVLSHTVSLKQQNKMKHLLSDADLQVLLNSVTRIASINTAFLKALATAVAGWKAPVEIGKTLVSFVPHFSQYGVFASAHEKALQVMSANLFREFTLRQQNLEEGMGSFSNLIIKPVQRLPRYQLLLQECIKKTDEQHSDYEDLQTALGKVKTACKQVDEIVSRRKDVEQLLQLRGRLVGLPNGFTLMQVGRKLIREGQLCVVSSKKKQVEQYFILLSDVLLRAELRVVPGKGKSAGKSPVSKGKIRCREVISLQQITAASVSSSVHPNAFSMTRKGKGKASAVLSAASAEDRDQWLAAIKAQRDKLDFTML